MAPSVTEDQMRRPPLRTSGLRDNGEASSSGRSVGRASKPANLDMKREGQSSGGPSPQLLALLHTLEKAFEGPRPPTFQQPKRHLQRRRPSQKPHKQVASETEAPTAAACLRRPLADASLTAALASAVNCSDLQQLCRQYSPRMSILHTAAAMKRLARIVRSLSVIVAPEGAAPAGQAEAQLFASLADKAMFLLPGAQSRQVLDLLSAVHMVAECREQQHPGWRRAVPPSASDRLRQDTEDADSDAEGGPPAAPATASEQEDVDGAVGPRPLHSSRVLLRAERELVRALLLHSRGLLLRAAAGAEPMGAAELQRLLALVGRMGLAPGDAWQDALFAVSLGHLPRMGREEMVALAVGVARLQPSRRPSPAWLSEFFSRSLRLMHTLEPRDLCCLATAASRLPRPHPEAWAQALLQRSSECLEGFDAPAYALLLHGVGRMKKRTPRAWVQEVLESSTSLLYDFSAGESDFPSALVPQMVLVILEL